MASLSLQRWHEVRMLRLDEIELAHSSVGGTGPGRRYATQQINHAYAVLLSSQFQGFCRDIHTESVDYLISVVSPTSLQLIVQAEFFRGRKLDSGNANPGNLGIDFGRLGLGFWDHVKAHDQRNRRRMGYLQEMNEWRNAIAHQDFDPSKFGGATTLHLAKVRIWRSACTGLASSFDAVLAAHVQVHVGRRPW